MPPDQSDSAATIARLERKLARERATRLQAETISEKGLRDIYERQQELQLLSRIAANSNQTISATEALQFAVVQICEYTSWEVGFSYLVSGPPEAPVLEPTALWHAAHRERIAQFRRFTEDMEFPRGVGLPGRAWEIGKPLWILDVTDDGNFPRRPHALEYGLKGATAFPVFSGNDVVAVLEFFASNAREPSATLLDLMSQIGQQLGRVIERQRAEDVMRKTNVELTTARDKANAADKAKSAFLANMSHELRTPLNAIIGFSEMLSTEIFGPMGNERYLGYAVDIHKSGTHLLGLINDILDISKLDADGLELHDDCVDLKAMVADCLHAVEILAKEAKIHLSTSLDVNLATIRADHRRLYQILLNLMSNAIKFTPENGAVQISAVIENEQLVIRVVDTGIGMAPEDIPRAVERFGQIDSTLARKYEGTGLGLPLVKKLVELHGGRLEIQSKLGAGTSVSVIFPKERILAVPRAA